MSTTTRDLKSFQQNQVQANGHGPNHAARKHMPGEGDLTNNEVSKLSRCEAVIEKGLQTFFEVGNALTTIREEKLYRKTDETFEDYCKRRWGISDRHGRRLIDAAEVVKNLTAAADESGPIGPLPTSESQARPLTQLHPDQQPDAWQEARDRAAKADEPLTAATVQAVVAERTTPRPAPDPPRDHTKRPISAELLKTLHDNCSVQKIAEPKNGKSSCYPPIEIDGKLRVCTGTAGGSDGLIDAECYEAVPFEEWTGPSYGYYEKFQLADKLGDAYRGYHGMRVSSRGKDYVLKGPKVTFVPEPKASRHTPKSRLNPFCRDPHGQSSWVDADSRLSALKSFTADQCKDALGIDDDSPGFLQKTVRAAVEKRIRALEKDARPTKPPPFQGNCAACSQPLTGSANYQLENGGCIHPSCLSAYQEKHKPKPPITAKQEHQQRITEEQRKREEQLESFMEVMDEELNNGFDPADDVEFALRFQPKPGFEGSTLEYWIETIRSMTRRILELEGKQQPVIDVEPTADTCPICGAPDFGDCPCAPDDVNAALAAREASK